MRQKKIKAAWLDYFNFSTRERRGAFFLALLLMLQTGALYYLRNASPRSTSPDEKLIAAISAFESTYPAEEIANRIDASASKLFPFDPNRMDTALAALIGLSGRQAKVIMNYLSKGGTFRTKKDFKKMYCISDKEYERLASFLLLPDSLRTNNLKKKEKTFPDVIDIGKADSATLLSLNGVGPAFASRIVRYRERLGGYCLKQQLLEVWGITDSVFEKLSASIMLSDTIPFRFVHLNTDSFNVLASHPYIKGKIASLICSYRKQHPFASVSELRLVPLITEENFRKLAPYLQAN